MWLQWQQQRTSSVHIIAIAIKSWHRTLCSQKTSVGTPAESSQPHNCCTSLTMNSCHVHCGPWASGAGIIRSRYILGTMYQERAHLSQSHLPPENLSWETGHTAHLVQCHLKIGILAEGTFSSLGFPGITNVDTGSTDTQITKFLDVGCLDNFSFCFCFSVL